jgi:hypothetical protein
MDDHDPQRRITEPQPRWHHQGAPVGAGSTLLRVGGLLVLLAQAQHTAPERTAARAPDAPWTWWSPEVTRTRPLDTKETTMHPHNSDAIAATQTMLARHAIRPGSARLLARLTRRYRGLTVLDRAGFHTAQTTEQAQDTWVKLLLLGVLLC